MSTLILYVKIRFGSNDVYLPVQKESKLFYMTKEYQRLDILGDTLNDRAKGIKRWPKGTTTVVKRDYDSIKDDINVMD